MKILKIFLKGENKYNFFENIDKTVDFVKELTNINFKNNSDICEKKKNYENLSYKSFKGTNDFVYNTLLKNKLIQNNDLFKRFIKSKEMRVIWSNCYFRYY